MTPVEASLADLAAALAEGRTTSVALLAACLQRIAAYDRCGPRLNAIPVLNPQAFADARASDLRRAAGKALGPLDGIPYTAKDSFKARGLTVAAGSPAFAGLIASDDAFAIARLRAAGAVLVGLTNMPPMANGGMQRGLYGRAESPYSADWLTAAFASGSSNGSGTATAASFAAFGLGEETWSSGRAPAALNGLCAYTPSRGVISVRGNWPLVPTMDVVVPHTRSMADLLLLLDTLVADDPETRGDFWRAQPWVRLPKPSRHRPTSYPALAASATLKGKRIAIPAMYINADAQAGGQGIGGPTGQRIMTRPSVIALWEQARKAMEAAGATILVTDFPVVTNYEADRPGAPSIATRGLVPPGYLKHEIVDLSAWSWDDFLRANGGTPGSLAEVDGATIFPHPPGALPDRYAGFDDDIAHYPEQARAHPCDDFRRIPTLEEGLRGLEATRKQDLEDWMDDLRLDAVVFPALADVAPADADVNPASADLAWRNGTWVANGNLAIRHLGIPTVTLPMGTMEDTGMPMGLTFAGRAQDDAALLQLALAFEATGPHRTAPPRTPDLPAPPVLSPRDAAAPRLTVTISRQQGRLGLTLAASAPMLWAWVDGQPVPGLPATSASLTLAGNRHRHSPWLPPYGPLAIALFADGQGAMLDLSASDS
ncbi:amidase [Tabrizicola soli]|uniref:Amidase n=1 Tax=Tabrizicola soli TaxID=2185115 RepID=A0ABV7DSD5_9RHOB|nr:amidase [Tabrizicola soli]